MRVAAYHLPSQVSRFDTQVLRFGDVTLELPAVTPALLTDVTAHLEKARERVGKRRAREIAETFIDVFTRWQDRTEPLRQVAEAVLPAVTRFSPSMVVHGLDLLFQGYRPEAFRQQGADAEELLHGFKSHGPQCSHSYGPALATHVLAGNIPGVGLPGIIASTLLGSASFVKTASADPLFLTLWAASVAKQDPEIGDSLTVLWWRGGEKDLEAVAFDRSDVVIAYGSEQTILDLQGRVRGKFLGYGHRLSFGVIGRGVPLGAEEVAQRAAYDASLFDQQGCLSPHLFYVEEGGDISPREFAGLLAAAMERWAGLLPPGSTTREEAVAVRKFRARYEAEELAGKEISIFTSPLGIDWTVIYEGDTTFTPSCLQRAVLVKPVKDLSEIGALIRVWSPYLQAAGVAVAPDRLGIIADQLGKAGVNRICPIGSMQVPPLTWRQDGRNLLRDLVRWVDLEA